MSGPARYIYGSRQNFSIVQIDADDVLVIPEGQQMVCYQEINIDLDGELDATLAEVVIFE